MLLLIKVITASRLYALLELLIRHIGWGRLFLFILESFGFFEEFSTCNDGFFDCWWRLLYRFGFFLPCLLLSARPLLGLIRTFQCASLLLLMEALIWFRILILTTSHLLATTIPFLSFLLFVEVLILARWSDTWASPLFVIVVPAIVVILIILVERRCMRLLVLLVRMPVMWPMVVIVVVMVVVMVSAISIFAIAVCVVMWGVVSTMTAAMIVLVGRCWATMATSLPTISTSTISVRLAWGSTTATKRRKAGIIVVTCRGAWTWPISTTVAVSTSAWRRRMVTTIVTLARAMISTTLSAAATRHAPMLRLRCVHLFVSVVLNWRIFRCVICYILMSLNSQCRFSNIGSWF